MANPNPNPGANRAGFFPRRPQNIAPINLRNAEDQGNNLTYEDAEIIVARAWLDFVGADMAHLQPRLPFPAGVAPYAIHVEILQAQAQLPIVDLTEEAYVQAYIDEAYRLLQARNQVIPAMPQNAHF